jgi:hypothetical protein
VGLCLRTGLFLSSRAPHPLGLITGDHFLVPPLEIPSLLPTFVFYRFLVRLTALVVQQYLFRFPAFARHALVDEDGFDDTFRVSFTSIVRRVATSIFETLTLDQVPQSFTLRSVLCWPFTELYDSFVDARRLLAGLKNR